MIDRHRQRTPAGARTRLRRGRPAHFAAFAPAAGLLAVLLSAPADAQKLDWKPRKDLNASLPGSLRVREAIDAKLPLRAWIVEARPDEREWRPRALLAEDTDGVETVLEMALRSGALVAINAGYFGGKQSYSLVVDEGRVLSRNVAVVTRETTSHHPTRAAFGIDELGKLDIAWIYHVGEVVYRFPAPSPIRPGAPQPQPSAAFPEGGEPWRLRLGLGGGPMLIESGRTRITFDEEVFFGAGIGQPESRQPRTALGYTRSGVLLMLVVDGRQDASAGATLTELAAELHALGALEALNLDGGGSTTLVVAGRLVNRPSDGGVARQVASSLALVPAAVDPRDK